MQAFQIIAIVVSLAFTAVAVVLTTKGVRSMVAVMRTGTAPTPRTTNPVGRTVTMVKETLLHTRMLQWTVVGIMHWFVYLAFIVLSAAVFTAFFQLFSPTFQLPLIGHFFLYEWVGEFLGVLGTIGIVYLAYYRQKHHPRREGRDSRFYRSTMWQAYFVEAFVLIEGSAILFIRGAEYNLGVLEGDDRFTRFHFPVSSFFGDVLYPSGAGSEGALETIIIAVAMIKIVLAMVWLIVLARNLTMGVAWHRFTAWPNIWFKREPSGRTALGAMKPLTIDGKRIGLDDVDDLDEDSVLGVGSLEDFSWKGILDFTTCTECGRCQSQCPAWNTEKPLNPKLLITAMRDATYARSEYTQAVKAGGEGAGATLIEGNDVLTLEAERPLVGETADDEWFYNPPSGAAVIDAEVLWNCTSCGACVQQCPVDIEHVDHIMDMRRYQVLVESNFPAQLNGLFKGLENKGNPWNMSSTARLDWAKGLDFPVKVVGEDVESLDEVDWLFWVGCAGAYEDRAKKTTRAVAELLDMAGVSFAVLGNGETCTGDPARRAGNEFVFQGLAQQNAEVLTESKAKKVVSTCAHCFNTLKNEYAEFGVELEVVHHTQLLNRLVREGKLTPVNDGAGAHKRSITYHDPCYIGRHNGVYSPPRELLSILPGAEYVEMERNSERSFCCGAGGAQMWMEETRGERINMNRTNEAVGTGADQIAVGCPFCRIMLSDGLTMKQSNEEARAEVEVLDVAQMLLASVKGEMATKLAPGTSQGDTSGQPEPEKTPVAGQRETSEEAADQGAELASRSAADEDVADDEDTVVAKPGTGGGSSLFDDSPGQSDTASADTPSADEAQAAKPASAGGSLFDLGGEGETTQQSTSSSASSEPTETAPTEAAASGGSLFDVGADDEVEESTASKPAAKPTETSTPEPASDSASEPVSSGGSLFDLGSDDEVEESTAAKPAEPEPAEAEKTEAAAAPAATSTPSSEIPDGGSLFDITAEETPAAPAAEPTSAEPAEAPTGEAPPQPEAAQQVEQAEEATESDVVESSDTGVTDDSPAAAPAAPAAASGSVSTPADSIPEGGSLFDIVAEEAPAPTRSAPAAPATEATDATPEAEPEGLDEAEKTVEGDVVESSDTTVSDDGGADPSQTESPVATTEAAVAPEATESAESVESTEADSAPADVPAPSESPARGGRRPGTAGSMFDFAAPATDGTTPMPAAPVAETTPEPVPAPATPRGSGGSMFDFASRSSSTSSSKPASTPAKAAPAAPAVPAAEEKAPVTSVADAPTAGLGAGVAVSAAATAAASETATAAASETDAPAASETEPDQQGEPTADASVDEATAPADDLAEQQSDAEGEVADAQGDGAPAAEAERAEPTETPEAEAPEAPEAAAPAPTGNGEAHQPRTDVEIGSGSLFDL